MAQYKHKKRSAVSFRLSGCRVILKELAILVLFGNYNFVMHIHKTTTYHVNNKPTHSEPEAFGSPEGLGS